MAATLLVLAGACLLLFIVLKAAPSDNHRFLRLERGGNGGHLEAVESKKAYDVSSFGEYARWLGSAATGDFGLSVSLRKGTEVSELIFPAVRESFVLLVAGMSLAVLIALLMAVWRFKSPVSPTGRVASYLLMFFSSIPVFLYVYALVSAGNRAIAWGAGEGYWGIPEWFPLPVTPALIPWLMAALILAVGDGGLMDLMQRFLSELNLAGSGEHLTGARAIGLSVPMEIARGFIPGAVSHIARRVSFFLGSMVVLEATMAWPGLGYLAWRAAGERDMPVLLGSALVMAATIRLAAIINGLLGYAADPRRRSA